MRWLLGAGVLALLIPVFSSCVATDPLGATTRERMRSEAAVRIAQAAAAAQVQASQLEASSAVQTATIWAAALPVLVLILVAGALAGVVLYFRGKAYLLAVARSAPPATPPLPDYERVLRDYAARTNQQLHRRSDGYYLVDRRTGKAVRALVKQDHTRVDSA